MSDFFREETELCSRLATLRASLPQPAALQPPDAPHVRDVLAALGEFMECVRYMNVRRSGGRIQTLSSEADVQDALYLILRPWVKDLIFENPTGKTANARYSIKDFLLPSARAVVEAKYIRDEAHGRSVSKELHDDIEVYRQHPLCDDLVFFVYDPNSFIPDQRALVSHIAIERSYPGKKLRTHLIVKP